MSNIYVLEPPTNGKVLLVTTVGDIDIDLWSKEAPKACRNFVQLCLEGYYNNTIFHRVIRDFIVQGGDPQGDGSSAGESIYGKPFNDEFHSRIRFVRRGLVAMANSGPNDNTSHFFFTLGPTPELNNKNTIFGRIGGETIYNMIKLVDCDIGSNDRPLYPHKILKTKVTQNPFDNVIPRNIPIKNSSHDEQKQSKGQIKSTKNFKLLSFGEEAEEDEDETIKVVEKYRVKGKSSHDLLNDERLSSIPAVQFDSPKSEDHHSSSSESDDDDDNDENQYQNQIDEIKAKLKKKSKNLKKRKNEKDVSKSMEEHEINDSMYKSKDTSKCTDDKIHNAMRESLPEYRLESDIISEKRLKDLKAEAKRLRRELAKTDCSKIGKGDNDEPKKKSFLEEFISETRTYRDVKNKSLLVGKGSDREAATLALLSKFKNKMDTAKKMSVYNDDDDSDNNDDNTNSNDLRKEESESNKNNRSSDGGKKDRKSSRRSKNEGSVEKDVRVIEKRQSLEDGIINSTEEDDDDDDGFSWMTHKLQFDKCKEIKVLDANITDIERYEIVDPRNPITARRRKIDLENKINSDKQAIKRKLETI